MKKIVLFNLILILSLLSSCQQLLQMMQQMNVQKPLVHVKEVKITGLSLKGIDLDFKMDIKNPNTVGITLAGFDYELLIDQNRFLKGQQNKTIKIESKGQSEVTIPVSLTFKQLFQTFKSLKDADSIKYTLKSGFSFNVPVLGKVRIPVQTTRRIPNIKLPKIKVAQLKLDQLGFTGADLELTLELDNPNVWSAALKKLTYQFTVNGQQWATGNLQQSLQITPKGKQILHLPIHLNFLEMGRSVYNLLTNPKTIEYQLQGESDLQSSIPLLGDFKLPLNQSGKVELIH